MLSIPMSLKEYMKVERSDRVRLQVCFISWPNSSTPEPIWRTVRSLSKGAGEQEVQTAIDLLIQQGRFIKLCKACKQLNVNGHMFDKDLCQGCASDVLGVVY